LDFTLIIKSRLPVGEVLPDGSDFPVKFFAAGEVGFVADGYVTFFMRFCGLRFFIYLANGGVG
jgi:hypothetical protein